jgi:hypothetical protein
MPDAYARRISMEAYSPNCPVVAFSKVRIALARCPMHPRSYCIYRLIKSGYETRSKEHRIGDLGLKLESVQDLSEEDVPPSALVSAQDAHKTPR